VGIIFIVPDVIHRSRAVYKVCYLYL